MYVYAHLFIHSYVNTPPPPADSFSHNLCIYQMRYLLFVVNKCAFYTYVFILFVFALPCLYAFHRYTYMHVSICMYVCLCICPILPQPVYLFALRSLFFAAEWAALPPAIAAECARSPNLLSWRSVVRSLSAPTLKRFGYRYLLFDFLSLFAC